VRHETKREAVANGTPDEGEAPVIVSVADAAMHMYTAAIESLPDPSDGEFASRAAVVLSGLRKLEAALSQAASRNRATPAVIVALSGVRTSYDELAETAADGPGSTLGQRLYLTRKRTKLSAQEAANGAGLRLDLIQAIEAEEPATEDESTKIKALITALGG
jgi:Arc/MetJ-type ribon-helix-helix transcriptional regulator